MIMTKVWKHRSTMYQRDIRVQELSLSRISLSMLPWNRNLATRSPYYVGEICRRSNVI